MAKQGIFTGSSPNDGTGDSLALGAIKVNQNFDEVYSTFGDGNNLISYVDTAGVSTVSGGLTGNPSINITRITGTATSSIIPFLYSSYSDLPSFSDYHGAFAHVHDTGKAYYAHTRWVELVNTNDDRTVGTGTENYNVGVITATTFYGDGSQLTGIAATGGGGGIGTDGSINTTGIITASAFVGDGSGLTGVSADSAWVNINLPGDGLGTYGQPLGIHTTKHVGIGTTADSATVLHIDASTVGSAGTPYGLRVDGDANINNVRFQNTNNGFTGFLFPSFQNEVGGGGNGYGSALQYNQLDDAPFHIRSHSKFTKTVQIGTSFYDVGDGAVLYPGIFMDGGSATIAVGLGITINGGTGIITATGFSAGAGGYSGVGGTSTFNNNISLGGTSGVSNITGLSRLELYEANGTSGNIVIGNNDTADSIDLNLSNTLENVFIGLGAGENFKQGNGNNIIGFYAGKQGTVGGSDYAYFNNIIGYNAAQKLTSGSYNQAIGEGSLQNLTSGERNIAIGNYPGLAVTTGDHNILLGDSANVTNGSDSYNIVIGKSITVNGNNNLAIGINGEKLITGVKDGAVELYYNNSKKFETTGAGVTVTGVLSATGGNSTDWNTAYSWGNHATAGYITTSITVDGLADVNAGAPSTGHVLKWSGTQWIAAADATASGGAGIGLSDLSVTITSAGINSLTYNDITGVFEFTPTDVSGFSTFSGDYNDLTNQPSIPSISGLASEGYVDNAVSTKADLSGATFTGVSTFQNNVHLLDDDKLLLGIGEDLQIYHASGNSFIDNTTGELRIRGANGSHVRIQSPSGEDSVVAAANGSVELYYDDSKKLETSNAGVTVTGTLAATSFSGDGSALTGITTSQIVGYSGGGGGGTIAGIDTTGTSFFNQINASGIVTASRFESSSAGTPTIDSPNNVNINAVTVAISTNLTVGTSVVAAGQTINSTGVQVTGVVTATSFVGDGSNLSGISITETDTLASVTVRGNTTTDNIVANYYENNDIAGDGTDRGYCIKYYVTANGFSAYRFAGPGLLNTTDNPAFYLQRGFTYMFENSTGTGHPFRIQFTGTTIGVGTYVQGSQTGTQYFTVPFDAPSSYEYECTLHSSMKGTFNVA